MTKRSFVDLKRMDTSTYSTKTFMYDSINYKRDIIFKHVYILIYIMHTILYTMAPYSCYLAKMSMHEGSRQKPDILQLNKKYSNEMKLERNMAASISKTYSSLKKVFKINRGCVLNNSWAHIL